MYFCDAVYAHSGVRTFDLENTTSYLPLLDYKTSITKHFVTVVVYKQFMPITFEDNHGQLTETFGR